MLVNVGSAWVRRQAQGARLTGVTASFLGLPLVRGLCPTLVTMSLGPTGFCG